MTGNAVPQPTVIRTSRGLSIAGRRLTLYSIMDYLQDDCPPHLIRDEFNLTDKQMAKESTSSTSNRYLKRSNCAW
jgi:hypothetical protein